MKRIQGFTRLHELDGEEQFYAAKILDSKANRFVTMHYNPIERLENFLTGKTHNLEINLKSMGMRYGWNLEYQLEQQIAVRS